MAVNEQASAYRKHRGADDKQGNLAWASRVGGRALRVSPEAAQKDIESLFELSDEEKLVWRVLRLARRYMDLEQSGLLPVEQLRAVLRGLVAADVVDMVEAEEAKALIPAELKKLRAELAGKEWRPAVGGLTPKVYRPDISTPPSEAVTSGEGAAVVEEAPKPVEKPKPKLVLNGAEKKLKEQLTVAAATLGSANHYVFLGVAQTANESTIRGAYVSLARDYHPDRLAGTALADDPESRHFVDILFKRLGDANKTLGNQETRARYDRELAALTKVQGSSASDARPRRPVEARQAYTMGESFFKKKDYKTAEMHYRQASMFDAEEPLILVALAWCIYLNPDHAEDHRIADARRRLEEVLKKHKTAEAAYKLGRVLKDAGDDAAAMKRFQEALTYNPGHTDAARELRLAEARKQKADEEQAKAEYAKKSVLQKLFTKK
jgi:curved DNA-binding protein CbpA